MQLHDKVALVTGGAQGIGMAICETFFKMDAKVAVLDIMDESAPEVINLQERWADNVFFVKADVSVLASVQAAVSKVIDKFSRIDILVNNAGITRDKLVLRMQEEDWNQVIQVNLTGAFNCIKAVSPLMLKRKSGRIVNITSIIGLRGNAGQANYAASKAGLIGLTKSCAREFASRRITVNAVAPGFIKTMMTDKLMQKDMAKGLTAQIPLGRVGSPEDVASLVGYLCLDESAYITGEVIRVDGGLSM